MSEYVNHSKEDTVDPALIKAVKFIQRSSRKRRDSIEYRRSLAFELLQKLQYSKEQEALKSVSLFNNLFNLVEEDRPRPSNAVRRSLRNSTRATKFDDLDYIYGVEYPMYQLPPIYFPLNEREFKKILHCVCRKELNVLPGHCVYNVLRCAAEELKMLPNINNIKLKRNKQVTVCGSLNGSLKDLINIFYMNGLPSKENPYVFNGNLVDSGQKNTEVLVVILAAYLTFPEAVYLNRGKHEDTVMNSCFGFTKELEENYPNFFAKILHWLEEVWRYMPLATVVNKGVFIVHGGIARATNMDMIATLDRSKYASLLRPNDAGIDIDEWRQVLILIWSTPKFCETMPRCSPHLAGCKYSFSDTIHFLKTYKLKYIISSIFYVSKGVQEMHHNTLILLTSVTDFFAPYSNVGAFLKLNSRLQLEVNVVPRKVRDQPPTTYQTMLDLENAALLGLKVLLYEKYRPLQKLLNNYDVKNLGLITMPEWSEAMETVTALNLQWQEYFWVLTNDDGELPVLTNSKVNYAKTLELLNNSTVHMAYYNSNYTRDLIYLNIKSVESIFIHFQTSYLGFITYEMFSNICNELSKFLSQGKRAKKKLLKLFQIIDNDHKGYITLNAFQDIFSFYMQYQRARSRLSLQGGGNGVGYSEDS